MANVNVSINDSLNENFRREVITRYKLGWKRGFVSKAIEEGIILWLTLPHDEVKKIVKEYREKNNIIDRFPEEISEQED